MEVKDKILQGAEELFMRYGIKSVTMDDVARELGISKKTLYQHVSNKADLLKQMFGCFTEEEEQEVEKIHDESTDAIDEMLRIAKMAIRQLRRVTPVAIYDLSKYYTREWRAFQRDHQQFRYQIVVRNLREGMAEGLYRENLDPDIVAKLYIGNDSIVDEKIFPAFEYQLEALFRQYFLYHIHGIASAKGLAVLEKHMDRNLDNID
ncbi:MAG: TetR/AcrR family transcriptional regulator [Saprospiraceae bacterium]|nr:TetR/AcrR family transcriptional regulator [Saprospiraceae bacterium]